MSTAANKSAFVPNGDSRRDTAIILLGTAEKNGLDSSAVHAVQGGFLVSDELADALGGDDAPDIDVPDEPTEAQKAVNQLEAQRPPVDNAEEAVDTAIAPGDDGTPDEDPEREPEPKAAKKTAKKTSGNRAAKNSTTEKE